MPRWLLPLAAALLAAGLAGLYVHARNLSGVPWKALSAPLPTAPGAEVAVDFEPPRNARYALAVEVDRVLPEALLLETVTTIHAPSTLDLAWRVEHGGRVLARGDARDYVFVDPGPVSPLGALRRILLRIPFEQDAAYFRSFGLLGKTTAARGVGTFAARAGERYRIHVRSTAGLAALAPAAPRVTVRLDRREWQQRYERTQAMAYASLVAIGAAGALLVLCTGTMLVARSRG